MDKLAQTTLITTIKTSPDARVQFGAWQEKMNDTVANFPGFVSLEMLPSLTKDQSVWMIVQRFGTAQDLNYWRRSKERQHLLNEAKLFLDNHDLSAIQEIDSADQNQKENVTEVFVTHVKPGQHDSYRAWATKIQQIESQFPGYQGVYLQAPSAAQDGNWITILRFDTPKNLDAWLSSPQRKEILKESESIVEALQSHRVASPFAGWFANIYKSTGSSPAVWKQTMLVLLVLFPIVMLEIKFLNPLTHGLNISLATFIGNAISVSLVSWPMMPLTIRYLDWWLSPKPDQRVKLNIYGALIVIALYILEIICFWWLL